MNRTENCSTRRRIDDAWFLCLFFRFVRLATIYVNSSVAYKGHAFFFCVVVSAAYRKFMCHLDVQLVCGGKKGNFQLIKFLTEFGIASYLSK